LATGVGDDIGAAADATGWLAIPHSHQAIATVYHSLTDCQVSLFGRLHQRQLFDMDGLANSSS
jgi:hypothetical protein